MKKKQNSKNAGKTTPAAKATKRDGSHAMGLTDRALILKARLDKMEDDEREKAVNAKIRSFDNQIKKLEKRSDELRFLIKKTPNSENYLKELESVTETLVKTAKSRDTYKSVL